MIAISYLAAEICHHRRLKLKTHLLRKIDICINFKNFGSSYHLSTDKESFDSAVIGI